MTDSVSPEATVDRRKILKFGAGFGLALAWPHSKVLGANDDIRVGVIGINGRGKAHIDGFGALKGVRVAALCDADPDVLHGRTEALSKDKDYKISGYTDMREMFEKGDIDVMATATPNHWHSLAGIWAMQAGKDAFVEKPVSHNVWEGRQLVKFARKHNRICQGGTQSRASGSIQAAVEYVRSGELGKIKWVKGLCYKARPSIGQGRGGGIPGGLDYDLWSGPANIEDPLRRKRFHYDWHWFYEYGNGDMGNQGIHQMDVARWYLGESRIAPRTLSIGGRLGYEDDGETPNSQLVIHDYETAPLIFETRGLPKAKEFQADGWGANMNSPEEFPDQSGVSVVVALDGGYVFTDAGGKVKIKDLDGKEIEAPKAHDSENIFANFITAVKSRKVEDLLSDCEETHISSALCHTGQISHRLGAKVNRGQIKEQIGDDKLLGERFGALDEHLKQNGVDIDKDGIILGPFLKFNPDTEWAEGNGDLDTPANRLATRDYRAPYIVPEVI